MNYTVHFDGYYIISEEVTTITPTGEYEEVLNTDIYEWEEFWLPKTIKIPKFEKKVEHTGKQIVYLKANQKVYSKIGIQRIGG